ncbi:MAG: MFS transporter [Pseudomonadales bacterium]
MGSPAIKNDALTSAERKSLLSLSLLYSTRMLGLFMVLPVLVILLEGYGEVSVMQAGLAMGAYGLTQALLQIPFGFWSDRWGRKPVILAGLLIFCIGSVVAALATDVNGVIIGRAMQGAGAVSSAILALLADLTREEQRSKAMAIVGASIGLTFGLSLLIGPFLSDVFGLSGLFWATAAMAGAGMLVLMFMVPSPQRRVNNEVSPAKEMFGKVLKDAGLWRLNFGIFTLHFIVTALFMVLPGLLRDQLGLELSDHWKVYVPVLGLSFIAMFPLVIISEKRGKIGLAFCSAVVILILSLLGLVFGSNVSGMLLVTLFVFFIGFNMLEALLPSLVSRQVFAGGRGTAMGVYTTCQFLGIFMGGSLSGLLLMVFGAVGLYIAAIALLLVWLAAAATMRYPNNTRSVVLFFDGLRFSAADLLESLPALPGVTDVMIVEGDATAYLKVDPKLFQAASLAPFSLEEAT